MTRYNAAIKLTLVVLSLVLAPKLIAADLTFPGGSITLQHGGGELTTPIKLVVFLTALTLVPALTIAMTAFTRIIVVLAMLRQAIGMPSTPPNSVLVSLALFLTAFTMMPVLEDVRKAAVDPYLDGKISDKQAIDAGLVPLKGFLIHQTRDKDIALILDLAHQQPPESADEIGFFQLIPAFMLSELRTAFEIGFIVFLPFVLIDIIVASVLMSLGMIMVPPLALSLPLKVLMFVLIDGWSLLTESLVRSFIH